MTDRVLEISDLNAWYDESHVLHGITFNVAAGETVTLIGRNGAGKTTILRSIVGLVRKRTGTMRVSGQDLMAMPVHRIARAGIGYIPEERGIFASLTVEENLLLPPVVAEGGMPLGEIFELFPNLYERRHSPGTKLSGGEQQMLAIARVLRTGVRILLLDEPTEGLAPVIVERIGKVLSVLRERGFTILLVEQNFRFASQLSDRMFVVEHGRIMDCLLASEVSDRTSDINMYLGL